MKRMNLLNANPWFWREILTPVIVTRLALLAVGWLSAHFHLETGYPIARAIQNGWQFSPIRLLDIWARWDSGWYFTILLNGYTPTANNPQGFTNLVFLPLYPWLVRLLTGFAPQRFAMQGLLAIGVLLSNLCLIGALGLLFQLARRLCAENEQDADAGRAGWYLLAYPAGFFLSAFYTESLFLLLTLGAFWCAERRNWALAGLLGGLAALTRLVGVFIFIPLAWLYLESLEWKLRRLNLQWLWLLLVPAGLGIYLMAVYRAAGDPLAAFTAHSSWGWQAAPPWQTFASVIHELQAGRLIYVMDWCFLMLFLLLSLLALVRLPSKSYGIYMLLLLAPSLAGGFLESATRFCMTAFPAFLVLAQLGRRWRFLDRLIPTMFLALQVALFAAWSQFYWVE